MKQTPPPCPRRARAWLLAGLSLLLTAGLSCNSLAQPGDKPTATETAPADRQPEQETDKAPAAADSASAGRFTPTEQISEDLSVSFPVDI